MRSNEFALFLDEIREARNVSKEDFVKDIVSQRQYYRFIKGESTLKSDIILELLERLELNNAFFYAYFKKTKDEEYGLLLDLYELIFLDQLDKANKLFQSIKAEDFTTAANQKFYQFCELFLKTKQKLISYESTCENLMKLIDYPAVMEKDVLTFTEKTILTYLANYLMTEKDYRIARFFHKIIEKEMETDEKIDTESATFRNVAVKCLGMIGEHEKSYDIICNTEEKFLSRDTFVPMIHNLYYKALEERNLFDDDRYRRSLQKMIALINLNDNQDFRQKYYTVIERRFGLKEADLIEYK